MIDDQVANKAVRVVFGHLRKKFRELDGEELQSAAGVGVAQAIQEYKADRTDALFLWLKIAGTQRAINALREDGFLGKDYVQNPQGSPANPTCESDLTSGGHDQFAQATSVVGDSPFPLDLFDHPCLTDSEKSVLVGRYADNQGWDDLSKKLGVPRRTCQRRHDSALKKLRQVLGEEP